MFRYKRREHWDIKLSLFWILVWVTRPWTKSFPSCVPKASKWRWVWCSL